MKRSLMPWFAIALLLGLNAEAKTQQDAQSQASNPHQNSNQQESQPGQQSANNQAEIERQVNQLQSDHLYHLTNQGAQSWTVNNGGGTWWEIANRTADLTLTPADDALRAHLGLPKDQGLIVTGLAANAPAAQAGIQQNDVLLKLGETALAKPDDLELVLKGSGDKPTSLTVMRAGKKFVVQVQPRVRVTMGPVQPEAPAFWIGISVSELEPALRSQLKLPQNQGLLAIEVHKDSPAAKAEVKVHDILLTLAEKPLDSQQKLVELVQANGEKSIPLELIREGKTLTIEVTPQRRKPTQVHLNVKMDNPQMFSYQLVRPGVLLTNPTVGGESAGTFAFQAQGAGPRQSQDATATVSKRLDDLDGEIKQLRKAIEELSKVLKDRR